MFHIKIDLERAPREPSAHNTPATCAGLRPGTHQDAGTSLLTGREVYPGHRSPANTARGLCRTAGGGGTPWPPEHDYAAVDGARLPPPRQGAGVSFPGSPGGIGGQSLEGTGKGPSSTVKGRSSVSASPGTPRTLSRDRCSGDGERGWGTPALLGRMRLKALLGGPTPTTEHSQGCAASSSLQDPLQAPLLGLLLS